jgi:hypothetical protein
MVFRPEHLRKPNTIGFVMLTLFAIDENSYGILLRTSIKAYHRGFGVLDFIP